jgi:hypothetical protein
MLLRDITVADIARGSRWLVPQFEETAEDEEAFRAGDFGVQPSEVFSEEDTVAYSGLYVQADAVLPLLLIKQVGAIEYGGDSFEMVNGKWRLSGEVPDPDTPPGEEFIADPLPEDPSFSTLDSDPEEYRRHHREGFRRLVTRLAPQ